MTQTGSLLLKSTGFRIGILETIALMLSKHLSNSGVHWKSHLLCAKPDNGVVYAVMSGMTCARYCTSPKKILDFIVISGCSSLPNVQHLVRFSVDSLVINDMAQTIDVV